MILPQQLIPRIATDTTEGVVDFDDAPFAIRHGNNVMEIQPGFIVDGFLQSVIGRLGEITQIPFMIQTRQDLRPQTVN